MQGFISSWAGSVTVAVLFSAMVSALLPESGIKKYVAVVLGIVVTIMILSPVFSLAGFDSEKELKNAVQNINTWQPEHPISSSYGDYIFKVYMSGE